MRLCTITAPLLQRPDNPGGGKHTHRYSFRAGRPGSGDCWPVGSAACIHILSVSGGVVGGGSLPERGDHDGRNTMRVAYADPPYLGQGAKIYKSYHPEAEKWDNPEYHSALIQSLCIEYDAWAMSLSSPSLRVILPMCPDDCRILSF